MDTAFANTSASNSSIETDLIFMSSGISSDEMLGNEGRSRALFGTLGVTRGAGFTIGADTAGVGVIIGVDIESVVVSGVTVLFVSVALVLPAGSFVVGVTWVSAVEDVVSLDVELGVSFVVEVVTVSCFTVVNSTVVLGVFVSAKTVPVQHKNMIRMGKKTNFNLTSEPPFQN